MRFPHFFKVYSRLGMPNIPHRMDKLNLGVEEAADFILTPNFLAQFSQFEVTKFTFPKPEEVSRGSYWSILSRYLTELKKLINQELRKGQTQVVVGGDNSVTFSSLLAVFERFQPEEIGYIQFDAHGEANSYKSSPTKNFHGMYLRPLVTDYDVAQINKLVFRKIPLQNLFFIGLADINKGDEESFYARQGLKIFTKDSLEYHPSQVSKALLDFIRRCKHIHINFDIDTMDKNIAPGTGIPAKNGLLYKEVMPLLKLCSQHPNLSIDLSEVNPKKDIDQKTIKVAQKILSTVLST